MSHSYLYNKHTTRCSLRMSTCEYSVMENEIENGVSAGALMLFEMPTKLIRFNRVKDCL